MNSERTKEGTLKTNVARENLVAMQNRLLKYADKEKDLRLEKTECKAGEDCDQLDQFIAEVKEKKASGNTELSELAKKKAEAESALRDDGDVEKTARGVQNEKRTKYVLAATTVGDDAAKEVQQKHNEDVADRSKQCECIDGVAASGYNCPKNRESLCESCDKGFFLADNNTRCAANICRCAFGSPIVARGVCARHNQ